MRVKLKKKNYEYILYFIIGIAVLIPLGRRYVTEGDILAEWIARVRELGEGHFYLFARSETLMDAGIRVNSMNSNLWFFLPGLLYRVSGSVTLAYRVYMLALQAGTLFSAVLLFRRIFPGEQGKYSVVFGTLLYMTNPYRIYICYDLANLSQTTAWMLLPLYFWAVAGVVEGREQIRNLVFGAVALAGIGYADTMFFVIAAGTTVLVSLFLRKFHVMLSVAGGSILFAPGLYRLIQYVFLDGFAELDMPLRSIMPYGYRLGYYFSSYSFRDGHPGMGLGMLICLLTGIWLRFVMGQKERHGRDRGFFWLAIFFWTLSFYYFPWDFVQRLGMWALKLVSLADTPSVFWGMAFLCLCVPAARFMDGIRKCEIKWAALAVPVIVVLACIGICVYQCNMLTYNRLPMEIL